MARQARGLQKQQEQPPYPASGLHLSAIPAAGSNQSGNVAAAGGGGFHHQPHLLMRQQLRGLEALLAAGVCHRQVGSMEGSVGCEMAGGPA